MLDPQPVMICTVAVVIYGIILAQYHRENSAALPYQKILKPFLDYSNLVCTKISFNPESIASHSMDEKKLKIISFREFEN